MKDPLSQSSSNCGGKGRVQTTRRKGSLIILDGGKCPEEEVKGRFREQEPRSCGGDGGKLRALTR